VSIGNRRTDERYSYTTRDTIVYGLDSSFPCAFTIADELVDDLLVRLKGEVGCQPFEHLVGERNVAELPNERLIPQRQDSIFAIKSPEHGQAARFAVYISALQIGPMLLEAIQELPDIAAPHIAKFFDDPAVAIPLALRHFSNLGKAVMHKNDR
jgi:hypothetical protein